MNAHVARLVPADFVDAIALRHLGEIPRYLDAVQQRLDGLQGRVEKDAQAAAEIGAFEERLARVVAKLGRREDLTTWLFGRGISGRGVRPAAAHKRQSVGQTHGDDTCAARRGSRCSLRARRH